MPGSNTPKPPACQIQAWLGCQRRTSSFQTISTERGVRPASQALASATAGAKRECQVAKSTASRARAASTISSTSPSVAAGGFSSSTSRPAASAFSAIAVRASGGTQSATTAGGPSARKLSRSVKLATPSMVAWRETPATRVKSGSAAIAGICWSRAILPTPTRATG